MIITRTSRPFGRPAPTISVGDALAGIGRIAKDSTKATFQAGYGFKRLTCSGVATLALADGTACGGVDGGSLGSTVYLGRSNGVTFQLPKPLGTGGGGTSASASAVVTSAFPGRPVPGTSVGTVVSIGASWVIDISDATACPVALGNTTFMTNLGTLITGSPGVGDAVTVSALCYADGSILATSIAKVISVAIMFEAVVVSEGSPSWVVAVTAGVVSSASSLSIGTGSKSFTVAAGLPFAAGLRVRATSEADGTNFMEGLVASYSGTALVVTINLVGGSGTYADWNFDACLSAAVTTQGSGLCLLTIGVGGGAIITGSPAINDTVEVVALCNITGTITATSITNKLSTRRIVAVGSPWHDTSIAYSDDDGATWTGLGESIFPTPALPHCVAWNGVRFVAGGNYSAGGNSLAYSDDGISWTGLGNAIFSSTCGYIVWNGVRFLAAGDGDPTVNTLAYSDDGITWAGLGTPLSNIVGLYALNDGRFMAVADSLGIYFSVDGITWSGPVGYTVTDLLGFASNGHRWVIAGGNAFTGNCLAYSDDEGVTWVGLGDMGFYGALSVVWNGTRFVAVGNANTNEIAHSTDGVSWTRLGLLGLKNCFSLVWTGTRFIVGCDGEGHVPSVAYSDDGLTWMIPASQPFPTGACMGLASAPSPILCLPGIPA